VAHGAEESKREACAGDGEIGEDNEMSSSAWRHATAMLFEAVRKSPRIRPSQRGKVIVRLGGSGAFRRIVSKVARIPNAHYPLWELPSGFDRHKRKLENMVRSLRLLNLGDNQ
jgi:hypothetical protein